MTLLRSGLLVLALEAAAAGSAAAAGAQEPLGLLDAVRSALATHPSLALARAATDRAGAGLNEVRATRLPSLALEGSATRFAQPMVVAPLHGFDPRQPPLFDETLVQGSVSASYILFDGGARGARIDRARAMAASAGAGMEAARLQVMAEAARGYLRLLAAREVASAHERRVGAVEQERARVERLFQEGRSARVGLMRAEAALSAARADLATARAEVEVAERELARVMGVDLERIRGVPLREVSLTATPFPGRDSLVAQAVSANPEVERVRAQVTAARAGRAEARSLWLPRVQVGGRYVEYASSLGPESGEWQGGVQLSYPLFTGGSRGAAGERAAAEERAAESELSLAARRAASAVDRVVADVEASRARVAALVLAVQQAEEVVRIERLALDNGVGVQSDYLAAEAELLRIRAALSEARYAEIGARVELGRLTGELSEPWIAHFLELER